MVTGNRGAPSEPSQILRPADRSIKLNTYLAELWNRRGYIRYVSESELRGQQMNTVLGNLWHLLNPMLQIAVFYIIFGLVLKADRGVDNLLPFIAVGLFAYQYSQTTIIKGASSISRNRPLLTSIWFPRAMLPLTTSLTQFLAFLPVLVVMFVVVLGSGQRPLWTWLAVPLIVVMQSAFNVGIALVVARAGSHVPDVQQLLPFVFRLLLYASGVLFLVDAYVENSSYRLLFELNPLYGIIAIWRWAMLGYDVDSIVPYVTPAMSALSLLFGFIWFRQGERSYTNVV